MNCKIVVIGSLANILFTCTSICRFRKEWRVIVLKLRRQKFNIDRFERFLLGSEGINCMVFFGPERSPSSAHGLESVFFLLLLISLKTRYS